MFFIYLLCSSTIEITVEMRLYSLKNLSSTAINLNFLRSVLYSSNNLIFLTFRVV